MRYSIARRVKAMHTHLQNRLGQSITFNRVKNALLDPETGESFTYWEQPSFTCTAIFEATQRHVDGTRGVVRLGDLGFVFAASDLTAQSGTDAAGRTDVGHPKPDDYITYNGDTYDLDLGDGVSIASLDPSNTLWTVWVRKRT